MRKKPPPFTAEHRANLSAAIKGKPHGPMSAETKAKLSASRKGKGCGPRPAGTGEKISASHIANGVRPSRNCLEASAQARRGKALSPQTIAKIVASNKGSKRKPYKRRSEETKARVAAARRERAKPAEWIVPQFPPVAGVDLVSAIATISVNGDRFYVYVLRRENGSPFYVGKGRTDRIAMHERDSKKQSNALYRHRIIRKAMQSGVGIGYELNGVYDDENEAFAEERRLIALYGRYDLRKGPLSNSTDGGDGSANPSEETIAKRVVGIKAAMNDPVRKAIAVKRLRSVEHIRVERARAACQTKEFRDATSRRFKKAWADPEFRQKTIAASTAAQRTLSWKAKHAAGVARVHADEGYLTRRLAAWRAPEVQSRIKASCNTLEHKARMRANAKSQRSGQEIVRQRVVALATILDVVDQLPNHRSSLSTWTEVEQDLSMFVSEGGAV